MKRTAFIFVVTILAAPALFAQFLGTVDDPWSALEPSRSIDSFSRRIAAAAPGSLWSILDVTTEVSANSAGVYGFNDRGWWQGRGVNALLLGGGTFRTGWIDVVVAPEFTYSQNVGYAYRQPASGDPEFGNYGGSIDQPQRFGDDSIVAAWPGNTSVTAHHLNTAVRIGTESITFGPGARNQLILSDNAPGFPHLSFGTYTPWNTAAGAVEWTLLWGRLSESEYFDSNSDNDFRLFVGGAVAWRPIWIPGWQMAVHRAIHSPWETADAYKAFQVFETLFKNLRRDYGNPTNEDDTDQTISASIEYTASATPFRVYLEWARNDHSANLRDILANPEHTRAYTTGFDYLHDLDSANSLRFRGEITVINPTPTRDVRPAGPWYRHSSSGGQGYTNHGQYLGAWIGSGANSQYAELGWINDRWGTYMGLFTERVVYDNDFFYALPDVSFVDFNYHLLAGARYAHQLPIATIRSEAHMGYHSSPYWLDERRRPMFRFAVSVTREL